MKKMKLWSKILIAGIAALLLVSIPVVVWANPGNQALQPEAPQEDVSLPEVPVAEASELQALEKWTEEIGEELYEGFLAEEDIPQQMENPDLTLSFAASVQKLVNERFQVYMQEHQDDDLTLEEIYTARDGLYEQVARELSGLDKYSSFAEVERDCTADMIPALVAGMSDEEKNDVLCRQRSIFHALLYQEEMLRRKKAGLDDSLAVVGPYLQSMYVDYIQPSDVCTFSDDGKTITFLYHVEWPDFAEDIRLLREAFPELTIIEGPADVLLPPERFAPPLVEQQG